jgi:hypothetical protein
MFHHSLVTVGALVVAIGLASQVQAAGYIVTNQGEQVVKARSGVGAHHDGITQLHGPGQQFIGLGDRDDIVQLHVNHQAIYIHPDAQYRTRRPGRIDENHSILRAQRLFQSRHTLPTRVIHRETVQSTGDGRLIQPSMILIRPEYRNRHNNPQKPGHQTIPIVPHPAPRNSKLMAAS